MDWWMIGILIAVVAVLSAGSVLISRRTRSALYSEPSGVPSAPNAGLPKPVEVVLWVLVALGAVEVMVVLAGSLLTWSMQLLPMAIVGLGDLSISALLLWALKKAAR